MAEQRDPQFREWLQTELRARRMSIRQLADRTGVAPSTISRIIRGERRPALHTAQRLTRVMRRPGDDGPGDGPGHIGHIETPRLDPMSEVERALRRDDQLDDLGVRRTMRVYLAARSGTTTGGPAAVALGPDSTPETSPDRR